jgi:sulfoxide reductase catalytic subunit YedY
MRRAHIACERAMKEPNRIPASEITAPEVYFNRRNFMRAGILAASALATGAVYRTLNHVSTKTVETHTIDGLVTSATPADETAGFHASDKATPFQDITHYNNFYEFSTDKQGGARTPRPSSKPKAGRWRPGDWWGSLKFSTWMKC